MNTRIAILIFALLSMCHVYGGTQTFQGVLLGTNISTSNQIHHQDSHLPLMQSDPSGWSLDFKNHSVKNTVSLQWNRNHLDVYNQTFTTTVSLLIEYEKEDFSVHTETVSLTVSGDLVGATSQELDAFTFEGGHRVKVSILSVTGSVDDLILSSEISVERYYIFDESQVITGLSSVQNVSTDNNIEIRWTPLADAEYYDLEWVFVNDYDGSGGYLTDADLNYDFRRNSTRIRLSDHYYRMAPIFEHGVIAYRVRGVGKKGANFEQDSEGAWTTTQAGALTLLNSAHKFYVTSPHQSDGMNWSYSAAYTEGGKQFEAVSYMDGLMFNRQNVGKNYSENQAIIQETYYDHQGRPALATLPTPVAETDMDFREGFNKNSLGATYSRADFDIDNGSDACLVDTDPMDDDYGTSKYYSPNNTDKDEYQAYVPEANEYPFVRTEYTPDNTGRIRRQGAAGDDYQLDSDHETHFFYGSPMQNKINDYFGTDVGHADKYQRNVVRDANGQLYISYVDMSGRVIASTMAGAAPTQPTDPATLSALSSNTGATQVTGELINSTTLQDNSTFGQLEFTKTFTSEHAGVYSFQYYLEPGQLDDTCLTNNVCFDCVYDVHIQVVDINCGNVVLDESSTIGSLTFDSLCNGSSSFNYDYVDLEATLGIGEYQVKKTLTVNMDAVDTYTDMYIRNNDCLLSYDDFYDAYIDSTDFSGCGLTPCELFCLDSLGTMQQYINNGGSEGEYNLAWDACLNACTIYKPCLGYEASMLFDLSPGGQYALYDYNDSTGVYTASAYDLSILNTSNDLESGRDWKDPYFPYENSDGTASLIENSSGNMVAPTDVSITLTDFMENWQPSWAKSLLQSHPEYCYLEFCYDNEASHQYDSYMLQTNTYQEALDSGYLNPVNSSGTPTGIGANTSNQDDYFVSGDGTITEMRDTIRTFYKLDNTTLDMWDMAWFITYCGDDTTDAAISACLAGMDYGKDSCTKDLLWQNFRSLYLSAKSFLYNEDQIDHAITNGCYNGCFGVASYNSANDPNPYNGTDAPCDNAGDYADKTPIFYDIKQHDYYGLSLSATLSQLDTAVASQMDTVCQKNCENQADEWIDALYACSPSLSTSDSTDFRNDLIDLCVLGCNENHPLGAITLPSGTTMTSRKSTTVSSFDDLLEDYYGSSYEDELCNVYLLNSPGIYNDSTSVYNSFTDMDTCACDKIMYAYTVYQDSSLVPSHVTSNDEMFTYLYGFPAGGHLNELACVCQSAWTQTHGSTAYNETLAWGTAADNFLDTTSTAIDVPSSIACPRCVYCDQVNSHVSAFNLAYPDADTTDRYTNMFTNYLNEKLNFDLSYDHYQDFIDSCAINGSAQICNVPTFSGASDTSTCISELIALAEYNAQTAYDAYLAQVKEDFKQDYVAHCLDAATTSESMDMQYYTYEYHATLYYYDQAGNLVQTVPPNGLDGSFVSTNVDADRPTPTVNTPSHTLSTQYRYNSFNQVIEQETPDGGKSNFWYDYAGRLALSQNAKQATYVGNYYSYTRYDAYGRVIEVGQLNALSAITEAVVKDPAQLETFITSGTQRREVTRTYYDKTLDASIASQFNNGQNYLRLRIATVAYYDAYTGSDLSYQHATHYSYDPHGNVEESIQDYPRLEDLEQDIKRTEYEFELISGNVNKVKYQAGEKDAYYHKYEYDADNRIKRVNTSEDDCTYDMDAEYFYYQHGPLARVETGDHKVQGSDYAYTINGWLKGMNSNTLDKSRDMGKDGGTGYSSTFGSLHGHVGVDKLGFTLGYYDGDYSAISQPLAANNFEAAYSGNVFGNASSNLYNGNIRHMVSAIGSLDILGTAYSYDQLNRLKSMDVYEGLDVANNTWAVTGSATTDYNTTYAYDPNGNLTTLTRRNATGALMDNFTYNYTTGTNRLDYVADAVGASLGADLANQSSGNYTYTEIGELKSDAHDEISDIEWRVDKKVKKLTRTGSSGKEQIEFEYDAMGNRVLKLVKPLVSGVVQSADKWTYTYYMRDAQGNVMAIYSSKRDISDTDLEEFTQIEVPLYGASRVGQYQNNELIATYDHGSSSNTLEAVIADETGRTLGNKMYEYANHLGNVLLVATDRKLAVDVGSNGTIDYFEPEVMQEIDYYPFGMEMPGRKTVSSDRYRYGFNGMEQDAEWSDSEGSSYDFGARFYDGRIGRWRSRDPLEAKYPWCSPYVFVANKPIIFVDPDGREIVWGFHEGDEKHVTLSKEQRIANLKVYENVTKMRLLSPEFDQVIRYLESLDQKIFVTSGTPEITKEGNYREYAGRVNYDKILHIDFVEDPITGTIAEEFFHIFQLLEYDMLQLIENADNYIDDTKHNVPFIEAEAKLFDWMVLRQVRKEDILPSGYYDGHTGEFDRKLGTSFSFHLSYEKGLDIESTEMRDFIGERSSGWEIWKVAFRDLFKDKTKLDGSPSSYSGEIKGGKPELLERLINDNSSSDNWDHRNGSIIESIPEDQT